MSVKALKRSKNLNKNQYVREHNKELLNGLNLGESGAIVQVFTKERIKTYASIAFLPPYGLYRIWSEKSTFRSSEKAAWSIIIGINIIQIIRFLL